MIDRPTCNVKVCDLDGVREYQEGLTLELWRTDKSHRLVVRIYNECGNRYVDIDLWDLIGWLQVGPGARLLENQTVVTSDGTDPSRNREGS
jgi:hypothetical protein